MTDKTNEPPKNSKGKKSTKKEQETALKIWNNPNPTLNDMSFLAKEFIQVTLPHSNPRGNPPAWQRTNGNLTLSIRPDHKKDPKTGELIAQYPYGTIPRLFLYWLNTEVIRKKSRIIELGSSLNGFLEDLGLNPANGGGKRSDAYRTKDQIDRLLGSMISFRYEDGRETSRLHLSVASRSTIWWLPEAPDQKGLFISKVEISQELYDMFMRSPVPHDLRLLKTLKSSALALDLYSWLLTRVFASIKQNKVQFIPWRALAKQFGSDYSDPKNFKKKAHTALKKINAIYGNELPMEFIRGGLEIYPSDKALKFLVPPKK